MTDATKAPTTRVTFSDADLACLEALRASRSATSTGWRLQHDHDETWDLISVQPPYAPEAVFLIIPGAAGGVLMTAKGTGEVAFSSLRAALVAIGPRGEDWSTDVSLRG
jgi:hypothetical protein